MAKEQNINELVQLLRTLKVSKVTFNRHLDTDFYLKFLMYVDKEWLKEIIDLPHIKDVEISGYDVNLKKWTSIQQGLLQTFTNNGLSISFEI